MPGLYGRLIRPLAPMVPLALALFLLLAEGSARAAELVMFETLGCIWCEAWDEEVGVVYHKTEEGRSAPLRRVDIDEPRTPGLEALQSVVYTPTFVLLDGGREVGRILGYPGEGHFWSLLGELLGRIPAQPGS